MLTLIDLVGLLPLLIVASTAVLVMLGVAWRRHHVVPRRSLSAVWPWPWRACRWPRPRPLRRR